MDDWHWRGCLGLEESPPPPSMETAEGQGFVSLCLLGYPQNMFVIVNKSQTRVLFYCICSKCIEQCVINTTREK